MNSRLRGVCEKKNILVLAWRTVIFDAYADSAGPEESILGSRSGSTCLQNHTSAWHWRFSGVVWAWSERAYFNARTGKYNVTVSGRQLARFYRNNKCPTLALTGENNKNIRILTTPWCKQFVTILSQQSYRQTKFWMKVWLHRWKYIYFYTIITLNTGTNSP